jgi:hypothetical protein
MMEHKLAQFIFELASFAFHYLAVVFQQGHLRFQILAQSTFLEIADIDSSRITIISLPFRIRSPHVRISLRIGAPFAVRLADAADRCRFRDSLRALQPPFRPLMDDPSRSAGGDRKRADEDRRWRRRLPDERIRLRRVANDRRRNDDSIGWIDSMMSIVLPNVSD